MTRALTFNEARTTMQYSYVFQSFAILMTAEQRQLNRLAVRKVDHLNIITKIVDFEARILIGWIVRVFVSQPIRTRASKFNISVLL